ncbi:acetyl-coenzyme a, partial [Cystoisospora suis]
MEAGKGERGGVTSENGSGILRGSSDDLYTPPSSPPVEVASDAADEVAKISSSLPVHERYKVPRQNRTRCQIHDYETYKHMHWRSLHDSESFWRE